MMSFLSWVVAGKTIQMTGLLQGSVLLSVPLIFGALSGVLCERAGVVNIAIEGQLLAGAFLSALVGSLTDSLLAGLIAAIVAGLLVSTILAVFAVRYFVDQVIVGVVINTLVLGLTSFFYTAVMTEDPETYNSPPVMQPIPIPILSDIPVIGPILFNQSLIVYLMYVIAILIHVALFKTRWGLRVRAVGEHPKAADTVGIDVNRLRFRNVLLGGMVSGLGGAFFTLGSVGAFGKNMTAGKGFIALAAMIFGRWSPLGRDRRGPAVRLRRPAAAGPEHHRNAHPQPVHADGALPRDAVRGRRPRRPVAGTGSRRHPVHQVVSRLVVDPASVDWSGLRAAARAAAEHAYVPYSHFPVGVAGLVDDGRVVSGCNVENASYGLTLCAECGMVSALHASGGGRLVAVVCVDQHGADLMPCGRCRQLLWEHGGPTCLVHTTNGILPDGSGPARRLRRRRPAHAHLTHHSMWGHLRR